MNMVACTKKCYERAKAGPSRRLPWSSDGKDGDNDLNNSERILLDWLLEPGNYNKFRGKGNSGTTKQQYCQQIAEKMNAAGVRVKRDFKQVLSKIHHMESSFRKAHTFANTETGQGLKEGDPGSFKEKVEGICPHYDDLYDIMADRSNTKPRAMTEDILASSASSSDDDEDLDVINNQSSNEEEAMSVEGHPGSSISDGTSATKRKSPPSIVAPTKRAVKTGISVLDEDTQAAFAAAARAKEGMFQAKATKLLRENEKEALNYRLWKMDKLQEIKTRYPQMTDQQIKNMFPELKDIVGFI